MRIKIRELSFILNILAGLIIVIWGLYKGIAFILPSFGNILDSIGRFFFANSDIPVPVRLAVPMLVVGIIMFLLSGKEGAKETPSRDLNKKNTKGV